MTGPNTSTKTRLDQTRETLVSIICDGVNEYMAMRVEQDQAAPGKACAEVCEMLLIATSQQIVKQLGAEPAGAALVLFLQSRWFGEHCRVEASKLLGVEP